MVPGGGRLKNRRVSISGVRAALLSWRQAPKLRIASKVDSGHTAALLGEHCSLFDDDLACVGGGGGLILLVSAVK